MKYIKIPAPVLLTDPLTDLPMRFPHPESGEMLIKNISFQEFMFQSVLSDEKHFGGNLDLIEQCMKIRTAIREAVKGNGILELEDADYKLFLEAIRHPSKGYQPAVVCQCLVFTEAVKNAASAALN